MVRTSLTPQWFVGDVRQDPCNSKPWYDKMYSFTVQYECFVTLAVSPTLPFSSRVCLSSAALNFVLEERWYLGTAYQLVYEFPQSSNVLSVTAIFSMRQISTCAKWPSNVEPNVPEA